MRFSSARSSPTAPASTFRRISGDDRQQRRKEYDDARAGRQRDFCEHRLRRAFSSNKGTSRFNVVPHTLDFFRVQSGEALTASVHGTEFSVDVANHSVTYDCTRGEVNVTKTGYLLIGQRPVRASFVDVISAVSRP